MHETRVARGFFNRMTPLKWALHSDAIGKRKTVDAVRAHCSGIEQPVVLSIGVGHGGLYDWLWQEPGTTRLGVDVNHDVMVAALAKKGRAIYHAIEADAAHLPFCDQSVDFVVFDCVLHHLEGQGTTANSVREGFRVLRPGGYLLAHEPSCYSLGGMTLNMANRFRLMHRLSGASNYEFALAPPRLIRLFEQYGKVLTAQGIFFLWSNRLPIFIQKLIRKSEPLLFRGRRSQWLADFLLYIVRKPTEPAAN